MPSRPTKFFASSAVKLVIWPKSPAIQVDFMRHLSSAGSGVIVGIVFIVLDANGGGTVRRGFRYCLGFEFLLEISHQIPTAKAILPAKSESSSSRKPNLT